ncbi:MAG: DUF1284 domain-containing protein [Clostridia bacterium]|nr:DUF1284 domain-containing protein [Clostridia bacterium]
MTTIIQYLEKNNPSVYFSEDCDKICSCCPNRHDNLCMTENKVRQFDLAFLQQCHLDFSAILHWQDLKTLATHNIIRKQLLSEVCKDCQWQCWKNQQ